MNKYEIKKQSIVYKGITLFRIEALKTFGFVEAGDLGGWIESEKNLSQKDSCWVSGNSKVFGNACVSDDAQVYGNAEVSGDTQVSGKTWLSGKDQIS